MKYTLSGLFFTLFTPVITFAQDVGGIVPCGLGNTPDCQACHLALLVDNILRFLIQIGAVLGVLALIYAGFLLVTSGDNASTRERGKSMIRNVLVGFLIMLGSWLIVDTIIKTFVDQSEFGIWNQVQCVNGPVMEAGGGTQRTGGGSIQVGSGDTDSNLPESSLIDDEDVQLNSLLVCMLGKMNIQSGDLVEFSTGNEIGFSLNDNKHYVMFDGNDNAAVIESNARSCGAERVIVEVDYVYISQ